MRQHEESNLSPDTPIKVDDNFKIPLNSFRLISDKEVDLADRIAVDARVHLKHGEIHMRGESRLRCTSVCVGGRGLYLA